MNLFPMFVKLAGRRCLVVGAGKIAEAKIRSLLRAGASVHIVAPRATPRVAAWVRSQEVSWERRKFLPRDLRGISLVIAATNSSRANESVFRAARHRRILCNAVDDPLRCDFYYPAVVRRGPLQIAISTSGASPALAQRLRRELELQFTSGFGLWVSQLGKSRGKIVAREPSSAHRRRILHRQASAAAYEEFRNSRSIVARGAKQ